MGAKIGCILFAGLTLVTVLLFLRARIPAEPEVLPVALDLPPETTQPETQPPDPRMEACRRVGQNIQASHAFVYDTGKGEMLWCNTETTAPLFPASITKLFTAWVALEILEPDRVVTAGRELGLLQPGSSTAFLAYGSRLTVEMLVEAMLLPSGNDAAYVLAAAAGQALTDREISAKAAVRLFMEEVNRRAGELGLENTHFVTPDGYHDPQHITCPKDLARIGELALGSGIIAKYAALQQDAVIFESGETITWYNTNRLLNPESAWYCDAAAGLKTGYTQEAGYCLLAAFRTEEGHILAGIFQADTKLSRYSDAADLYHAAVSP